MNMGDTISTAVKRVQQRDDISLQSSDVPVDADSKAPVNLYKRVATEKQLLNEDDNRTLRFHFHYDRAPSTTLCLSILELYDDPVKIADACIRLSSDLSRKLPNAPENTDLYLAISSMKRLIINAKVKLLQVGDPLRFG